MKLPTMKLAEKKMMNKRQNSVKKKGILEKVFSQEFFLALKGLNTLQLEEQNYEIPRRSSRKK